MVNQASPSRLVSKPFLKVCWVSPLICLKTNHGIPQVPCGQTVFRGLLPWLGRHPCPRRSAPTGPKLSLAGPQLFFCSWKTGDSVSWPWLLRTLRTRVIKAPPSMPLMSTQDPGVGKNMPVQPCSLALVSLSGRPPTPSTMLANAAHDKHAPYLSPFSTLCGAPAIFLP